MTDYSTLLPDHVMLKCRSIDRISFLKPYVGVEVDLRRRR
jgi:hypothetical protein